MAQLSCCWHTRRTCLRDLTLNLHEVHVNMWDCKVVTRVWACLLPGQLCDHFLVSLVPEAHDNSWR